MAVFAGSGNRPAAADTLIGALIQAYQSNPQINSQRALVRATDENVAVALSGYRPRVGVTASAGQQTVSTTSRQATLPGTPAQYLTQSGYNFPHSAGVTATQTLFNGFQTANRTRQAESQVSAARETLRNTEQNVLLAAATAYMNVLRDGALVELQHRNVDVLTEQVRQTRDRLRVGEVTRTDLAQAESRLAGGRSQALAAESNYKTSVAVYRQVIGTQPGPLSPGTPVDRFSPKNLSDAVVISIAQHPSVTSAQYNVDSAALQVKIAESALYPTLTLQAGFQKNWESTLTLLQSYNASVVSQLSIPLYQGGSEYATIRQAKETLGQRRQDLDVAREQVRQGVVQAWGQVEAAKANIQATDAQVRAAEIALNGVREEARVGQRTTLDVLNAQQELVNARSALVTAQRDRVVASYTLLASAGRLSPEVLGLGVQRYDAQTHYHQVRDSWVGVRTPDGQ